MLSRVKSGEGKRPPRADVVIRKKWQANKKEAKRASKEKENVEDVAYKGYTRKMMATPVKLDKEDFKDVAKKAALTTVGLGLSKAAYRKYQEKKNKKKSRKK